MREPHAVGLAVRALFFRGMDPLTHTLAGANLAATGLGRKSRFAAAALILGANAPDIDAITYFMDSDLALGVRRGWTHGVLALIVLPLVQTALLALLDRLRRGDRPFRAGWVLALSAIGVWSHPVLDWLNTYGMRWLMPFDGTWFYGDSVYIMDPWLWLVLGAGWLAGRKPSIGLVAAWLLFALLLARVVARRSPEYLVVLALVALVLLVALMWRAAADRPELVRRLAVCALVISVVYVSSRVLVSRVSSRSVAARLSAVGVGPVESVMVSPDPIDPTRWAFVAQTGEAYRFGRLDWFRSVVFTLDPESIPRPRESPPCAAARRDSSVAGFVIWARFPACEVEQRAGSTVVHLFDARRARPGRGGLGARTVVLPAEK